MDIEEAVEGIIAPKVTQEIAEMVFAESQKTVPVDTGELKASGSVQRARDGFTVAYSAPYAYFVHEDARGRGFKWLDRAVFKVASQL